MNVKFGGSGMIESCWSWIKENIPEGSVVVELGSGDVSTPLLVSRYKVYSVEENPKYVDRYPEVNYISANLINGWYNPEPLQIYLPSRAALTYIDGPSDLDVRWKLIDYLYLFDPTSYFLIDDVWHEKPKMLKEAIQKYYLKADITPEDHYDGELAQWRVLK